MRIYYPINKEEPTPALPKGGSLNEAQYSDTHPQPLPKGGGQGTSTYTTNRLTSNGRPPPLGRGWGWVSLVEVAPQGIAD